MLVCCELFHGRNDLVLLSATTTAGGEKPRYETNREDRRILNAVNDPRVSRNGNDEKIIALAPAGRS
jgi:hypothetical protein